MQSYNSTDSVIQSEKEPNSNGQCRKECCREEEKHEIF